MPEGSQGEERTDKDPRGQGGEGAERPGLHLDELPESFEDYLRVGGFPAYVASENRQVLVELFNDIIYRDVVVRYRLANAERIRQLAGYVLAHIGTRLAPSRLKDSIHVQSAKTVLEYFERKLGMEVLGKMSDD